MHWVLRVALGLAVGYALGAAAGYAGVQAFSGNMHDRDLEAAMTAAFATGPLGAALGVAVALVMGSRRRGSDRG
jgi:transketolase N-terminal domain/subunit